MLRQKKKERVALGKNDTNYKNYFSYTNIFLYNNKRKALRYQSQHNCVYVCVFFPAASLMINMFGRNM
jgi:hypothetical protein